MKTYYLIPLLFLSACSTTPKLALRPQQWQRPVSTTLQRPDGREFVRRSCPAYAVHSRRSPALISRHPFHGQGFAGKRAGQQPLQGLHLAPAAFPCCLYDTRLQPPDLAFTFGPVHLIPLRRLARGRTHG